MHKDSKLRQRVQWIGLVAGPLVAGLCLLVLPQTYADAAGRELAFGFAGRATLSVMAWMATWWLTEAIHISATALLPLVLFPAFGVSNMQQAAAPYADPLIFLFMGGFLLALAMQRWGLGKRIALLTLTYIGAQPLRLIAGFMLTTAVLSAFVSNAATTAMMLPIALSVIALLGRDRKAPKPVRDDHLSGLASQNDASQNDASQNDAKLDDVDHQEMEQENFGLCLLLGIAYSASVGGVATIIGSPPNAILVGFLRERIAAPHRVDISMAQWLLIGGPLAIIFLPVVFLMLTRFLYPVRIRRIEGATELIDDELQGLGSANRGEWATFVVFVSTAAIWISRPWLVQLENAWGGGFHPFAALGDAGVAMLAAVALFVIPVDLRKREFVLDWNTAQQLPWAILILFGGGLSLANAVQNSGVAEFIGSQATFFAGMPPVILVLVVCGAIIFLTELTSNTATAATLLPVLAALAPGLGIHPYLLVFPAAFAASFAFMLPVATPPNAIIFGSGRVTIPQMAKAGVWLNVIGIGVVTLLTALLLGPVLEVKLW